MRSSVRIAAAAASVATLISARLSLGQVAYFPLLYVTSPIAAITGSVAVPNPNAVALPSSDYFASLFSGNVSALNDSGNVAFATNTSNGAATPTTENSVLISTETGTTTALGQANYAISAAPSLTWTNSSSSTFTTIYLDSAGQTSVLASTSGGSAVFSERSGTLSQVLGASSAWNVSGTATTTTGYTTVTAIGIMEANPSGQLAYDLNSSSVIATDLSTGSTAAAPTLIAAAGGAAPGTNGATFRTSVMGGLEINPSGQVAFGAWLTAGTGSPVVVASGTTENDHGLWTNTSGSLALVLRMHDQVPTGTGGLVTTDLFGANAQGTYYSYDMNNAGNIVVQSLLMNGGSGSSVVTTGALENNVALFAGTNENNLSLVARAGYTPAPGATGALFNYSTSTFYRPVINDTGKLLFQAYIAGGTINDTGLSAATTPRQGLFTGTPGSLTDLAYVGDPAPDGGTFTSFGGTYAENDLGEAVFSATITGSPYTGTQWFATDASGQIHELLAVGQTFMVNGIPETISGFGVNVVDSGGEDGLTNAWNDQGQLAATIDFTNGTGGVFLVSVPEPASLALLTISSLALLGRRPRRANA